LSISPFNNLERLASSVASREHASRISSLLVTKAVEEENQQHAQDMQRMHSHAMSVFANAQLALNKLHAGGRWG
jgi:hypothetical protein